MESKILLPTAGAHVFGLTPNPEIATMFVPPVIKSDNIWDLDYSTLLLFDKIVMDTLAKDFIDTANVAEHKQLKESIHILGEEGKVDFVDYSQLTNNTENELKIILESELRDPIHWFDETKKALFGWKNISKNLFEGEPSHLANDLEEVPFGIWFYLKKSGLNLEKNEMNYVENLFSKKRKKYTSHEQEIIREVSKTYLTNVNHTLLLSRETNSATYDWNSLSSFYHTKFIRAVNNQGGKLHEAEKIRELFNVAVPDYKPRKAIDFVKLQNDKRIKSLRDLIKTAVENKTQFDREFYIRTMEELLLKGRKSNKSRIRKALLSREVALGTVKYIRDRSENKKYQWLLLLTDYK